METLPPVWMLTSAVFTLLTVMISCAYISLKQKRVALPLALASPTTDTPTATRWETDDRGAGDGEMDAVESSDASIDHDANDDGLKNTWETRNWSTTTGIILIWDLTATDRVPAIIIHQSFNHPLPLREVMPHDPRPRARSRPGQGSGQPRTRAYRIPSISWSILTIDCTTFQFVYCLLTRHCH